MSPLKLHVKCTSGHLKCPIRVQVYHENKCIAVRLPKYVTMDPKHGPPVAILLVLEPRRITLEPSTQQTHA